MPDEEIILIPEAVLMQRINFLKEAKDAVEKLNNYTEAVKYQYAINQFESFFNNQKRITLSEEINS